MPARAKAILYTLSFDQADGNAANLGKLAALLGANVELRSTDLAELRAAPNGSVIAVSADGLAERAGDQTWAILQRAVRERGLQVLATGWRSTAPQANGIKVLTGGIASFVPKAETGSRRFVTHEGRAYSFQLAGCGYEGTSRRSDAGFTTIPNHPDCCPLITAGTLHLLVVVRMGAGAIFLSSFPAIADIDGHAPRDFRLSEIYDELLPALIFIRTAFAEWCWRSRLDTSHLIIDDPLLSRKYGRLDFDRLLRSMSTVGYSSTVAFIPWNHWRTSAKNARYFLTHADRLSICVHGCDHTGNEFGSCDETLLTYKAELSLKRMRQHFDRTGVPFQPVMVFPQGQFSSRAPRALRLAGFTAAINTEVLPVDVDGVVQIRDFLLPAVTRFHGFPIFVRHYPKSDIDFALDLFLGRPAFVVQHHEFFADGLPRLEELVINLKKRSANLRWLPLEEAVRSTVSERSENGDLRLRFFSDYVEFKNESLDRITYSLQRPEPDPEFVNSVRLDGNEIEFERTDSGLRLRVCLDPSQKARISVHLKTVPTKSISIPISYKARVLLRRGLSEFRDEFLSNHPGLLSVARWTVRRFDKTRPQLPTRGGLSKDEEDTLAPHS